MSKKRQNEWKRQGLARMPFENNQIAFDLYMLHEVTESLRQRS